MFVIPEKGKFNDRVEDTFQYFFAKFINICLIMELDINISLFKSRIDNNINLIFTKFCHSFQKFDLFYKFFY